MISSLLISPPLLAQQNTDTGWKVVNKDVYKKDTSGSVVIGATSGTVTEKLTVGGDVRIDGLKGAGNRIVYADQEGKLKTDNGGGPPDWWIAPDRSGGNSGGGAGNGMSGIGQILGGCAWTDNGNQEYTTQCKVGIGTNIAKHTLDVHGHIGLENHLIFNSSSTHGIINWPANGSLYFRTNSPAGNINGYVDRMIITKDGNVGIGTATPKTRLDVNGDVNINGGISLFNSNFHIGTNCGSNCLSTLGIDIPKEFLHIKAGIDNSEIWLESKIGNIWALSSTNTGEFVIYSRNQSSPAFRIKNNLDVTIPGWVGIGTENPQSELAVNGTVTAKRHVTTMTGWSDFVFNKEYRLPDLLKEVAPFIKTKGHLPGIPTEKEVISKGLDLGDINAKLLTKVEELTLYAIDLQKQTLELRNERTQIYWLIGLLGITVILLQVWRGRRG